MTDTLTPTPQVSIFADFLDEEVYVIGQFAEQLTYPAGAGVFAQGSADRSLYVVIEGQLYAKIKPSSGEELMVGEIQAGDVFGELSFLDGLPRTATVTCAEDATLLKLARPHFDQLQAEYPGIAAKLMSDLALVLSLRLRSADQMIANLSTRAAL